MKILDRYSGAVNSSNLAVDAKTTFSDSDVLGAMGIADRRLTYDERHPHSLAVKLARLFMGDNKAAREIVAVLAEMAFKKRSAMKVKLKRVQAKDMAKAALAWHRDGTCKPCGGHGKTLIPGTKTLSDHECQPCLGSGKMPFERQFKVEHRELARWLVVEMETEMGVAGPAAMMALAPKLEL